MGRPQRSAGPWKSSLLNMTALQSTRLLAHSYKGHQTDTTRMVHPTHAAKDKRFIVRWLRQGKLKLQVSAIIHKLGSKIMIHIFIWSTCGPRDHETISLLCSYFRPTKLISPLLAELRMHPPSKCHGQAFESIAAQYHRSSNKPAWSVQVGLVTLEWSPAFLALAKTGHYLVPWASLVIFVSLHKDN